MMPRKVWREGLGLCCGGGEEMGGRGVATVFGDSAGLRIEICCTVWAGVQFDTIELNIFFMPASTFEKQVSYSTTKMLE
jgi:hypothetical protein